jgi:hypothetical protein
MQGIRLEGDPKEYYRRAELEEDFTPYLEAIATGNRADIINLLFPIPYRLLRMLYRASDVVLTDSSYNPFGLAGMEAMVTGAVVFSSRMADGYAKHMYNSVILNNYSAKEIQFYVDHLRLYPEKREGISTSAIQTAKQRTWGKVVETLISKLESQLRAQGRSLPSETTNLEPEKAT